MTASLSVSDALAAFAGDAGVRIALLLEADGRVIAQHGFTRRVDIVSASTLAAAIQATARELGRLLGDATFGPIHHAGGARQLFVAPIDDTAPSRLLLTVFDEATSLGLVRVYWEDLSRALRQAPPPATPPAARLPESFERDLQESLTALFGTGG